MSYEHDAECQHPSPEVILHGCKEAIAKYGHYCVGVGADEDEDSPTFTYTLGLIETYTHPELVIVGLPPTLAHQIIADVVVLIKQGRSIGDGDHPAEVIQNHTDRKSTR